MIRLPLLGIGLAVFATVQAGEPAPPAGHYELAIVDLQGQKKVLGTLPDSVFSPRVSPDGTRVAFELADPVVPNQPALTRLYVARLDEPLDKRKALQLTVSAPRNVAAVWSPDGDWIGFQASGNGGDTLYYERADGWIQPKYLIDGRAFEGWYRDGLMTYITLTGNRDYGISALDFRTRKTTRLVDYPGTEQHSARISPDGKWIAYASNETGRQEVWLEPLPQSGKRLQVTHTSGRHPQWSPDGTKLYFDDQTGQLFEVAITLGAQPSAGTARMLPIKGFLQGDLRRQYDILPDGKGFVMLFPVR
jgi:Tol biopolymer transport system component